MFIRVFNKILNKLKSIIAVYIKKLYYLFLLFFSKKLIHKDDSIILSLTSMPARIKSSWISIVSLLNQKHKNYKLILVLSTEEFPMRRIPWTLNFLKSKGLEILWTKKNIRSYKKLLPVRKKYPNSIIITFDDDVFYESWRVSDLVKENINNPLSIIGYRGAEVKKDKNKKILPYKSWQNVQQQTLSENIFLTGVGGILYPPNIEFDLLIQNYSLAKKLCPYADDVFFWAISNFLNIKKVCLLRPCIEEIYEMRNVPKLCLKNNNNLNKINNDSQIQNCKNYFKI